MTKNKTEKIIIRPESPRDYQETEAMIREAFWDLYKPGCNEHLILHKLRESAELVKELNLVACDEKKVVGMIACVKAKIINDQRQEFPALSMMVGILPSYQKRGIGLMLIKRVIEIARSLGYKGIVIFGHPEYYHRFGFKNAKEYGIQTSDGQNFDPFMALELSQNSLDGMQGRFFESPAFQPISDCNELEAFDKQFPYKEKHITDTQLSK